MNDKAYAQYLCGIITEAQYQEAVAQGDMFRKTFFQNPPDKVLKDRVENLINTHGIDAVWMVVNAVKNRMDREKRAPEYPPA